ncbi:MAG: hypothetical protein ACKV0T_03330, partial [Planctomycetales bacterium]
MPLSWRSAVWFFGLCCLAAAGLVTHSVSPACLADDPPAGARLDREQLLVYRDADGKAQPVQEVADWAKRRTEIVAGMQQVMGPFPGKEKRTDLEVQIEEEVDLGTYVRRKLS